MASPAFVPGGVAFHQLRASRATQRACLFREHVSARPARGRVTMHGGAAPAQTDSERRPGSRKGFVEEMRFVAMRLHTKDQAPREGQQEESALPIQEWRPSQRDYLQFLVDSKYIYDYIEGVVESNDDADLAVFRKSGLERGGPLADDIQWFEAQGIVCNEPTAKASKYVDYLEKLVEERPKAFLCHWYNYYFAHSAGGRMIGRMMSNLLFDGKVFGFYEWERDVKEILGDVRVKIDERAKEWTRQEKDECLEETSLAFAYSGTILGNLAVAGP